MSVTATPHLPHRPSLHERLCAAIEARHVLYFCYKDGELRVIEPHCYWETAFGALLLRAWQRSGFSESGEPTGWKTFRVDRLLAFESTSQRFEGPHEGYVPFGSISASRYFAFVPPEVPEWIEAPSVL